MCLATCSQQAVLERELVLAIAPIWRLFYSGHASDKTLYIALNYQAQIDHMRNDTTEEVAGQLVTLEREQEQLNYYVSLLGPRHAELLKLLYFEGYSQKACAQKLGIATRTVRRIKDDAIVELVELYSFAGGCKQGVS